MMNEDRTRENEARRSSTFGQTVVTVLWSFLGVRKRVDHDRVAATLNPVHVIVAGLIATALFVLTLLLIVHAVVK